MQTRRFGPQGVPVAAMGQGTWQLDAVERGQALAALHRGVELGLTHIDTAEMYGAGAAEALVGTLIAELAGTGRSGLFVTTKVMPQNASYAGTIAACERSLRRLRTDYLDLFLLHWPGRLPLGETLRAFETLVADAKVRAFGVSNFDVPELEQALSLAGPGRIACNQVCYHLQARGIEQRVLPYCRAHGISVVGYASLGSGRRFPATHPVLIEIAKRHAATPQQLALRFLLRDADLFAIPKASSVGHVEDNARALSIDLSAAELAAIDEAFAVGPPTARAP